MRATRTEALSDSRPPVGERLGLAVVIPTVDEEQSIEATLRSIQGQTLPVSRVVVVDGGSTDRTVELAERLGASVWRCPWRGRGRQVAYAVSSIDEPIVLVAHADMVLPPDAVETIQATFARRPDCPGGCLGHRFDRRALRYRFVEWFDWVRARFLGSAYGDQAQFFRRDLLAGRGGFPDQPIMEDIELSTRLRGLGRPAYLGKPVAVSARRFRRLGYLRTIWFNLQLRRSYRRHGLAVCQAIYERYYGIDGAAQRLGKRDRRAPFGAEVG